jgi:hypothetical protein
MTWNPFVKPCYPVTLNNEELELARWVAQRRVSYSVHNGLRQLYGSAGPTSQDERLLKDIQGCCGELVVAKGLNLYWPAPCHATQGPDLGTCIQVRYGSQPHYRLIVRENADDRHWYVLVTGTPPTFQIVGGIWARDAKQQHWWEDPKDYGFAYFVPHSALTTITEWTLPDTDLPYIGRTPCDP